MQLQIPESLIHIYKLEEKFYHVEKISNGEVIISSPETGYEIELNKRDVKDILEHNNDFLSEKNQVYELKRDYLLYL